jgi:hypothetical protein
MPLYIASDHLTRLLTLVFNLSQVLRQLCDSILNSVRRDMGREAQYKEITQLSSAQLHVPPETTSHQIEFGIQIVETPSPGTRFPSAYRLRFVYFWLA